MHSEITHIPQTLHFIWIGPHKIPEDFLVNLSMISSLAKNSHFETYLWTDSESKNLLNLSVLTSNSLNQQKQAEESEAEGPLFDRYEATKLDSDTRDTLLGHLNSVKIRNVAELLPHANPRLWHTIKREMVGQANYSAASDLLRYEILRQEGGYYFDLDLQPIITQNSPKRLVVPPAPHGFLCYCVEWGSVDNSQKHSLRPIEAKIGTHLLASTPHHEIINQAIVIAMDNYEEFDQTAVMPGGAHLPNHPLLFMDLKRSKKDFTIASGRKQLTIRASGPGVIQDALGNFTRDKNLQDFSGFSFPLQALENEGWSEYIFIPMINAKSSFANTWLKKSSEDPTAFEEPSKFPLNSENHPRRPGS